jgi:D-3-phosphoglycerate dehydrogenase
VVANTDYCILEVAEHTLALLLACARRLGPATAAIRAGNWNKRSFMKPLVGLSEQTLGIAGFGRIGQQLARMAAPLVKRVIVYDPWISSSPISSSPSVDRVSFDELLSLSDFISLHCPLTEDSRGMFIAASIGQMRPTARLSMRRGTAGG